MAKNCLNESCYRSQSKATCSILVVEGTTPDQATTNGGLNDVLLIAKTPLHQVTIEDENEQRTNFHNIVQMQQPRADVIVGAMIAPITLKNITVKVKVTAPLSEKKKKKHLGNKRNKRNKSWMRILFVLLVYLISPANAADCTVVDGSLANNDDCTCGSTNCDATSGLYCVLSLNVCIPGCQSGKKLVVSSSNVAWCGLCQEGKFTATMNELTCKNCPKGWYQSNVGKQYCIPCNPGKTQSVKGSTECNACAKGKYMPSSEAVKAECLDCAEGTYQNQVQATGCQLCGSGQYGTPNVEIRVSVSVACTACPVATYSSAQGVTKKKDCNSCPPGKASSEIGNTKSSDCIPCSPNTYANTSKTVTCYQCGSSSSSTKGATFCGQCNAGKFMNLAKECEICVPGKVSAYGKKECTDCQAGYYTNVDHSGCDPCAAGKYSEQLRQTTEGTCLPCKLGTYSSATGAGNANLCNKCQPGRYSNTKQNDIGCNPCPKGYMQDISGSASCKLLGTDAIGLGGGAAEVKVPPGSYLTGCTSEKDDTSCTGFATCPMGWVGSTTELIQQCSSCPEGTSSFEGTTRCRMCSKGKFSNTMASAACIDCDVQFFQPQDLKPSTKCISCPAGYIQDLKGESLCLDTAGIKPDNCGDDEYWVPNKEKSNKAGCEQCPAGGYCVGPIEASGVRSLFGWARCKDDQTFERCLGKACLGAANPLLAGKYINSSGSDPATIDQQERCAHGHVNPPINNTRCSRCLPTFAPTSSVGGRCLPCSSDDGQGDTAILVLIGVLAFGLFALLILMKMRSSGRKKAAHSTLKRTLLTHVQMISIIMSLNVQWPDTVRSILVGVSGLISVSGHTSALHCSSDSDLSTAYIHYVTLSIASMLPLFMCLISWIYWFLCVPRVPACGCTKKLRVSAYCFKKNPFVLNARRSTISESEQASASNRHWKSTRDGWIATNVYFVYIVFPSIVRMSFETFQMQEICGAQYLAMDDTELFEGERRRAFAEYVALPAMMLYMLVLPILTMVYFWKQHSVMWTNHKMVFRFGLLYSGYAKDRWYWEIFVVARKIVLIFIVTFQRSNESQLHFALGVLIFILYLQERGKPFEGRVESTSAKQKKQQHMLHLSEVGSVVVLLIMVWVAVFFNVSPCSTDDWNCVALSFLVFCSNLVFVAMCSYVGCRAFVERNHLNEKLAKMRSVFRKKSAEGGSSGSSVHGRPQALSQRELQNSKFHDATMFPTQSIHDQVLGAVTLKQNPLANGRNRLVSARQRTAAEKVVNVELAVVRQQDELEQVDVVVTELPLPLNWEKVSGMNGEEDCYYWNMETDETQFDRPIDSSTTCILPLNWEKVSGMNGEEDTSYYWNTETDETQFEFPKKA